MKTPVVIPVGTEDGAVVSVVLYEEEIRQAEQDGISEYELIELERSSYRHWQSDC